MNEQPKDRTTGMLEWVSAEPVSQPSRIYSSRQFGTAKTGHRYLIGRQVVSGVWCWQLNPADGDASAMHFAASRAEAKAACEWHLLGVLDTEKEGNL